MLYTKEALYMATTNLNIRTDKEIKVQAEEIFSELGLNMTTAINMFLRTAIREHGIPFELKLDVPNDVTLAAIEEGRRMMSDPSAPRYSSIEALKEALEV
jgi:addiction module antitoxin, relB/dinJ family